MAEARVSEELASALGAFRPVSLSALDDRAPLLQRVDTKYAVSAQRLGRLLEQLSEDHEVLEIDGRRIFAYRTVYFDTPDRRCFHDHVEDRVPRFKARTRCYADTGSCVFEVKIKHERGETNKHQIDYDPSDAGRLTGAAVRFLADSLRDAGLEPEEGLAPSLSSAFDRITLAAIGRPERLTCDVGVELCSPTGPTATVRDSLVLVESKTEQGDSPTDQALAGAGLQPVSVSKYRVGVSLVGEAGAARPQPGSELFELSARAQETAAGRVSSPNSEA